MTSDLLARPPLLAPGARVALVAPAGPLRDAEPELARAMDNARSLGWEPVAGAHARAGTRYLAGTDAERLADLNDAIRDPRIDGVWCLRGGYGVMRLLDGIDYEALRRRPKAIVGYSDITALHLAARARAGVVSFHGPTARAVLSPFSRASLERAVASDGDPCGALPDPCALRGGSAAGRLAGGNLALVCALAATPYAARFDGAIVVLEDVNEPVYRVDRMLRQLRLSGALRGAAGLAFGGFTDRGEAEWNDDDTLSTVLREAASWVQGPVVVGIPVGHIEDQWTLPLGERAVLDADAGTLVVDRSART